MTAEMPPDFGRRLWRRSAIDGVQVTKVWSTSQFRRSAVHRLFYYWTAPLLTFIAATTEPCDVIIASSPPFLLGPLAVLLSHFRRVPLVLELRDGWLEIAVARGMVPRALVKPLRTLERWLLNQATRVVAVTPGLRELAYERLPAEQHGKVLLVMNGFEEEVFAQADIQINAGLAQAYDLQGKFVVIYAGTLGMALDSMTLVRAAAALRDDPGIVFVFIGEGEAKSPMQEFVQASGLTNCRFVPLQPRRDIPAWMTLASVGINSSRQEKAMATSLSNKIFDYMGSGIPVVYAGAGDTKTLLDESKGGVAVPSGDSEAMAGAIRAYRRSPQARLRAGRRGRDYVLANYSRGRLVAPMEAMLRAITVKRA
jgi:glycosyltransferase involved in cell wall biosynthesis